MTESCNASASQVLDDLKKEKKEHELIKLLVNTLASYRADPSIAAGRGDCWNCSSSSVTCADWWLFIRTRVHPYIIEGLKL